LQYKAYPYVWRLMFRRLSMQQGTPALRIKLLKQHQSIDIFVALMNECVLSFAYNSSPEPCVFARRRQQAAERCGQPQKKRGKYLAATVIFIIFASFKKHTLYNTNRFRHPKIFVLNNYFDKSRI